jgi:hypothetical protein
MVPESLRVRWEAAYRSYGNASMRSASAASGDRGAARLIASTSREVAAVWREMEALPNLPWWTVAALAAAAQAFEFQARDWTARAESIQDPPARTDSLPTAPTEALPVTADLTTTPLKLHYGPYPAAS